MTSRLHSSQPSNSRENASFDDTQLSDPAMQAKNCETGYFVTLSITKPHTIYTTVYQLDFSTNCATATTTEQQVIVTTTQSSASVNSQTAVSNNGDNISATTIGIIVRCIILGVLLLLALCCILRQQKKCFYRSSRLIARPTGPSGSSGPREAPDIQGQSGPQRAQGYPESLGAADLAESAKISEVRDNSEPFGSPEDQEYRGPPESHGPPGSSGSSESTESQESQESQESRETPEIDESRELHGSSSSHGLQGVQEVQSVQSVQNVQSVQSV